MASGTETLRIAAMADVHCARTSRGELAPLFARAAEEADILLLCGDLTDYGLAEEAHLLVDELRTARGLPTVAVLGNHDYESGQQAEVVRILCDAGVQMLDGEACEVRGVGFAGAKGFCGGFGARTLGMWGEDVLKAFVREAVDEAIKLENALARLRTPQKIAVLHYAPIQATVVGEPQEIYPFMGTSRLEDPLLRYEVAAVFHGHAHHGTPEGRTARDVPVYNVSLPLLRATAPDGPPFRLLELDVPREAAQAHEPAEMT